MSDVHIYVEGYLDDALQESDGKLVSKYSPGMTFSKDGCLHFEQDTGYDYYDGTWGEVDANLYFTEEGLLKMLEFIRGE